MIDRRQLLTGAAAIAATAALPSDIPVETISEITEVERLTIAQAHRAGELYNGLGYLRDLRNLEGVTVLERVERRPIAEEWQSCLSASNTQTLRPTRC